MGYAPMFFRLGPGYTEINVNGVLQKKLLCSIMFDVLAWTGFWEVLTYGVLALFKSDWSTVGGFNERRFADKWGGEDWDVIDRSVPLLVSLVLFTISTHHTQYTHPHTHHMYTHTIHTPTPHIHHIHITHTHATCESCMVALPLLELFPTVTKYSGCVIPVSFTTTTAGMACGETRPLT